jgi:hypothetical protein
MRNLTLGVEQSQPAENKANKREENGKTSEDDLGVGPLPP